jgi:7-keto-8-aminopelargonate synthetase-like enzyme
MEGSNQTPCALQLVIDQHIVSAARKACDARQRLGSAFLEAGSGGAGSRNIDAAQAALDEAESELSDWQAVKCAILTTAVGVRG